MTANLFNGDGSNLTNTTDYKLNTTTPVGRGNTLNFVEGSNITITPSSNV
jgi:hypothetical protein